MKVCYIYIKKYKNLEDIGISLDSHYIFEFDKGKKVLSVHENTRYIACFYGDNIYSLAVIAGKNGVGKSNTLRFLLNAVVDGMGDKSDCEGITVYKDRDRLLCSPEDTDIKVEYNGRPIESCPHKSCRTFFYTSHPIYNIRNWDILAQELGGMYNASDSVRCLYDQEKYVNDGKPKGTLSYYEYLLAHLSQRSFKLLQFLIGYYRNDRVIKGLTIPPYILILVNSSGFYKYTHTNAIKSDKTYNRQIRDWNDVRNATLYDFFITALLNKTTNQNEYEKWQPLIDGWEKKVRNSQDENVIKLWEEWISGEKYQDELQRILTVVNTINQKCLFNKTTGHFFFYLRDNLDALSEFVSLIYNNREFLAARYFDVALSYDGGTDAMMSSGEEKLLYLLAEIYYSHIIEEKKFDNIKPPTLYVLDEAELGLHPDWQRTFVSYLLAFFDYYQQRNIQILLTTHSPILLSDILRQDIVLLNKEDGHTFVDEKNKETFGTNIFELYRDSFFLNDGLMGKLAEKKITEIVQDIENRRNLENLALRISMIGDPQIRNYLTMKYAAIDQNRAISLLENQIEQIRRGDYGND